MSLLLQDTDLITITLYYSIKQNKYGVKFIKVLEDKEAKKSMAEPESAKAVKVLNTRWRHQTWQAQNELFAAATVYNPATGNRDIDWTKFRDARLKACLVSWDLTDDNGREYPVNEDTINALHAAVANALNMKYDDATSMTEDEVGN